MSQTYTDNVFATDHAVQTDMQNIENNFVALKSTFWGPDAPSDPVAGMWWGDTTNKIIKLRNEANNAWLSIWDFANNKPIVTNIVSADFAAALKDPAAGTAGLRTLGTTGIKAAAGNDSRFETVPNAYVTQAKLKTSQGSVSVTYTQANITLPGGEYGFYPQTKTSHTNFGSEVLASIAGGDSTAGSASYITNIFLGNESGAIGYAQQRYVTSSGEVFWIFILRDKITKAVKAMYQAPDHPCFGNGGKPSLVSHPFGSYDPETQEIIVLNPSHEDVAIMKAECIKGEDEPDLDLLELLTNLKDDQGNITRGAVYDIDEESTPLWPSIPVTVGLPKDYETKAMGGKIIPIKKVIPRPAGVLVKNLRRK